MISSRRLWIFVAAFLGILTVGASTLALRLPFTPEILRKRVVEALSDRLAAEVELGDVTLRVLPALHAEGTNLGICHKGRRDVPPLISIDKFTVDADLLGLWRNHVAHEALAFNGSLFTDARVSQTTTDWTSLMLKVVDPLLRKDGRTVIPIKISGTRNAPSFGMDVRRVFRRGDSEP